jgi:hypothetical protein
MRWRGKRWRRSELSDCFGAERGDRSMIRSSFCGTALAFFFIICLGPGASAQDGCPVPKAWLPRTPPPINDTPPPHPAPDCPFYRAAWQNFLYVMQPGPDGEPRFLSSYATIADLFGAAATPQLAQRQAGVLSLAPRTAQFPNEKLLHIPGNPPGIDAGVNQAGPLRGLLIDQTGNPIYYAIHVNEVYSNQSERIDYKDRLAKCRSR